MEKSIAEKKIQDLLDNPGKCITNIYRNSSGTLWESLWKFEDGKVRQKTCASGLFTGWYTFENKKLAVDSFARELKRIKNNG